MISALRLCKVLPTNRAAWIVATLAIFSLLWLPPCNYFDFCRAFFDRNAGDTVVSGVRVVFPISLALLVIACAVAWCVQGIGVLAFRRWVYPQLEGRYGAGVVLTYVVSPRRLWAGRWFRRCVFASALVLILVLSLCAFFRAWCPSDFEAYRGMAAECHPVWRAFAFRQFSRGDPDTALFAKYRPTQQDEFGRYGVYQFYQGDLKDSIPFTGFVVITRDRRLLTAGAWSCTWSFVFFETADPLFDRDYEAHLQERRAKRRQSRNE